MLKIKRRDFIKGSAAIAGAAGVAGSPVFNALTKAVAAPGDKGGENPEVQWIHSVCQGCTTWCAVEIGVQEDPVTGVRRAVQVRGNQTFGTGDGKIDGYHGGFCCPRGVLAIQEQYDPDRIKTPMKRTNPEKGRGVDPKFVPISWDEALDEIADNLLELRADGVPESLVTMRGRYTDVNEVLYGGFSQVFGSPNYTSHSTICAEAEKFAYQHSFGRFGYMDYDVDHSDYCLLWSVDPTSSNRQVPASIHKFGDRVAAGMKYVVVDPRLSSAGAKAHRWLAPKVGTDGALATALAHELLVTGGWYKPFVGLDDTVFTAGADAVVGTVPEKGTLGLVDWWNLELKGCTPEWAAGITAIDAATIRAVAAELAAAAPRVISWVGAGMTMHPTAAYNGYAAAALNGLLGSCDHEGGVLHPASLSPGNAGFPANTSFRDAIAVTGNGKRRLDRQTPTTGPALPLDMPAMTTSLGGARVTNAFADGINSEFPYKARMAIGYWSNFAFSCPGAQRWEAAFSKVYFVSMGLNACESSWFADIVLPTPHHMFESFAAIGAHARRYTVYGLQKIAVDPIWDVRQAETEFVWTLAEKLNAKGWDRLLVWLQSFRDPITNAAPTDAQSFHEICVRIRAVGSYAAVDRQAAWDNMVGTGIRYNTFAPTWFNGDGRGQRWRRAAGLEAGSAFSTRSGKFEFCNPDIGTGGTLTLASMLNTHKNSHSVGLDTVLDAMNYTRTAQGVRDKGEKYAYIPHYEPPFIAGSESQYPFVFVDFKSRLNREGRSANTSWYHEFKSNDPGDERHTDVLKMNPADVAALGLRDGQSVRITSTITPPEGVLCRLKAWEGVAPGTVTKSFGQGHWAYGRQASSLFGRVARGANNNEFIPAEYERMTASAARNGIVRVKVTAV